MPSRKTINGDEDWNTPYTKGGKRSFAPVCVEVRYAGQNGH
jgi:hypothetical protein